MGKLRGELQTGEQLGADGEVGGAAHDAQPFVLGEEGWRSLPECRPWLWSVIALLCFHLKLTG